MNPTTLSTILEILDTQRAHVRKVLNELTNDACNWNPQADKNSVAVLIEHLTGSEAYWIQELILGQKINRVRDKEFEYRYRSKKELKTAYEYLSKSTRDILNNKLNDSNLMEQRPVKNGSKTVLWILLHMVEHNYYHIGQINYLAGLLKGDKFLERPRIMFEEKN
ncbi:MAG: hypothetical protein HeimC3_11400 [Candidatus Heimdallarchaeota archaeon LC_3]|nr:MAG: hypothetical protein HeimC3_11400 [Candidatus Heimdallarchaeota archaeon LC_3]